MPVLAPAGSVARHETRALGSKLSFTTVAIEASAADAAWAAIADVFDTVDRAMSRFRSDSEISELNRRWPNVAPGSVSNPLYEALALCERARRSTNGRFDPRILTDLERLGSLGFVDPDRPAATGSGDDRSGPVLERVPRSRSVRLRSAVDLGGIGKGLALRWARDRVRKHLGAVGERPNGPSGFLIDAGGDLVLDGPAPNGGPWRVAIESPVGGNDPVAVIDVVTGAVATSSVRINNWRSPSGEDVHHIIDPVTGRPAGSGLRSVTVWWSDPAWAEVWSKSLFVAGEASIERESRASRLAVWWVGADGQLAMSEPARAMTIWS